MNEEIASNPRMNGPDVLALQKRLLELQFYELGEADGYYGPMTEAVIKKIQDHRGLPYPYFPQSFFLDNVVYVMV